MAKVYHVCNGHTLRQPPANALCVRIVCKYCKFTDHQVCDQSTTFLESSVMGILS